MVQLKLAIEGTPLLYILDFNSIMVQLKHDTSVDIANYTVVFQFHNGTIKTLFAVCLEGYSDVISIP